DVAGTPLRAAMDPAVRDDPGPDARADLDHDHVVVSGGDARPPLPERQEIDVVVDPDGGAVAGREPLTDRVAIPARHDRWRDGTPRLELDGTRDADADPPQLTRDGPGRPKQGVQQIVNAIETRIGTVLDPRGLVVMAEDPAVEARDGHVDAGRAEVRHQDVPGVRPERELAGRPAARARTDVAFREEPAIDQLADPAGDDR